MVDEIVVTGSRIARDPNATAPVPVQAVSGLDIQRSGVIDAADVLKDIPSLLTSVSSQSSGTGSVFSARGSTGESVLQLRGMGRERTLVLVNGRRHVSGVAGSQSVDVGSIPISLIERVEVLTGGASALYGADAVTGVVNYILKEDFEGFEVDVIGGVSSRGDSENYRLGATFGQNFADGRGNVSVAADYSRQRQLRFADRGFSRNNGVGRNLPNPDRRFQAGDIDAAATPNFAQFFNLDAGRFPTGFNIPSADGFAASYEAEFGAAPNLTQAELGLIQRASDAPPRTIERQPTFSISSNRGVIAPGDFSSPNIDLDGNGVADCEQSSVGFNSSLDFASAFGVLGGCWVVDDNGSVRPFQDGRIAGLTNQYGGDGIQDNFDADLLIPEDEKINLNLLARYELSPRATVFVEAKYAHQETEFGGPLNTFYDLLTVTTENPFIPAELVGLAEDTGGLFVTRDPTDLGPNIDKNTRETWRGLLGLDGTFANGWNYEVSANYGRFEREQDDRNRVIQDRFFAAIDVITDGAGNPICRSDVDPTPPPTTPFDIPLFDMGFFTFQPGDGSCRPANILGGPNAISPEAVDFITATATNQFTLEQLVFSGFLVGDFGQWFSLPAGDIQFAVGAEYREEKSSSEFDPLVLGVIPQNSLVDPTDPNSEVIPAGTLISDRDDFRQNALVFDPATLIANSGGDFDVYEAFAEISVPLLADQFLARELSLDAAARYSDYSTVGSTWSWKVGGSWAPLDDIRFRSTYSKAVRAPNIGELFDSDQGAFFRPNDPCEQAAIDNLIADGDPRGPVRQVNCLADGLPAGFSDPLTARFSGVAGGNPNLNEETAKTLTLGFVLQPRMLDGLTLTVDYWDIEIEDAISAVSSQEIVNNCYDSPTFPNEFCSLFTRNQDATSPQFRGFNFLRQTDVNFGAIESRGVDVDARYLFEVGANMFALSINGSYMEKLDFFFDPGDPTAVDPELKEIQRPRWSGSVRLNWARGPLSATWTTRYLSEMSLRDVEIEDIGPVYSADAVVDAVYIHDLNASYELSETMEVYGGVRNIGDRKPFITETQYPVSAVGRSFFLGLTARF